MYQTFSDLIDHVTAYAGDDAGRSATMKGRTAVVTAYKHLPTLQTWSYLWGLGRVITNAGVGTDTDASTVAYTASTRTVTLSGATWPSWAADGYVSIANTPYAVQSVPSSTTLILTAATAPAADIAAGTSYQLLRDQYPLPADFLSLDEVTVNGIGTVLAYMHPRDWASERRSVTGPGSPWMFSLVGDPVRIGRSKMVVWPPPDGVYNIDFPYRRTPRPLVYDRVTDGFASVALDGVTVTGTGTAFKAAHVGSVIRFGVNNQDEPTGDTGLNPAAHEAIITAVASATSLTIDTAAPEAVDAAKYLISDPVDIDRTVMGELLLREVERQFRIVGRTGSPKQQAEEMTAYSLALTVAREADVRFTGRQAALRSQTRRSGFMHYPVQFTGG